MGLQDRQSRLSTSLWEAAGKRQVINLSGCCSRLLRRPIPASPMRMRPQVTRASASSLSTATSFASPRSTPGYEGGPAAKSRGWEAGSAWSRGGGGVRWAGAMPALRETPEAEGASPGPPQVPHEGLRRFHEPEPGRPWKGVKVGLSGRGRGASP